MQGIKIFTLFNKYKYHILSIITIFIVYLISAKQVKKISSNGQIIRDLNSSFNRIEIYMRKKDYDAACKETVYSNTLINKNLTQLKEIEPKYNWHEIQELLNVMPTQICHKEKILRGFEKIDTSI